MRPHHGQRPARRHHHPQEHPTRVVGCQTQPGLLAYGTGQKPQSPPRKRPGTPRFRPPRTGVRTATLHRPRRAGALSGAPHLEPPHAPQALPRAQREVPPAGGHRHGRGDGRALRHLSEAHARLHPPHLPPRRHRTGAGRPSLHRGFRVLSEDLMRLQPQHDDEVSGELQEDHPPGAVPQVDGGGPLRRDALQDAARAARDA